MSGFGPKTETNKCGHVARCEPQLKLYVKKVLKAGKDFISYWFTRESERREKEEIQELPSKMYRVPSVEVHRAKNESSSHRQGLRMGTENTGFRRGSKRGVQEIKGFGFKKCPQGFLGFLLSSKR